MELTRREVEHPLQKRFANATNDDLCRPQNQMARPEAATENDQGQKKYHSTGFEQMAEFARAQTLIKNLPEKSGDQRQ
jgi:hypothetical protein